ncbi:MAG: hypothetical protein PVG22_18820 [Chromatiales bacterium]|jgi:hypothetical protein
MNVFILNPGRCGSTTFIRACRHITNYSAGHESRVNLTGDERLAYPPDHIEADNRLSWLLGRLERRFGDDALYVHLSRTRQASVESFSRRAHFGIMQAYRAGILLGGRQQSDREIALDYLETVDSNIALFLKDKTHKMDFRLEHAKQDFPLFWELIGAQGDLVKALAEWDIRYNASTN